MDSAAQSLSLPLDLLNGRCSYTSAEGSPRFSLQLLAPRRSSSLLVFKTTRDLQNVEGFSHDFPKMHCKLGQKEIYLHPLKQKGRRSKASTQVPSQWQLQLRTGSWDISRQALMYLASINHVPHKDRANTVTPHK